MEKFSRVKKKTSHMYLVFFLFFIMYQPLLFFLPLDKAISFSAPRTTTGPSVLRHVPVAGFQRRTKHNYTQFAFFFFWDTMIDEFSVPTGGWTISLTWAAVKKKNHTKRPSVIFTIQYTTCSGEKKNQDCHSRLPTQRGFCSCDISLRKFKGKI